jgi:hypothetical protein
MMRNTPTVQSPVVCMVALALAFAGADAAPVTGWIERTGDTPVSGLNTASPILGNGSVDSADNMSIYASIPTVTLASVGDKVTFSGSVSLSGIVGGHNQFRWGLYDRNGSSGDSGWLGYIGNAGHSSTGASLFERANPNTVWYMLSTGGANQTIATAPAPGAALTDGTYGFSLILERTAGGMRISQSMLRIFDSQQFGLISMEDSTPQTMSFNRVAFLMGDALNVDQAQFSHIDVTYVPVVADVTPPVLVNTLPSDDAPAATFHTNLILTFNEPIKKGSGDIVVRLAENGAEVERIPVIAENVAVNGASVTIQRSNPLQPNTGYFVEIASGAILDLADQAYPGFTGGSAWNFSTTGPLLPTQIAEIAPDGAWTWFNDERAIYHQGYLFAGYVLGDGRYGVTRYQPVAGTADHSIISTAASQEKDDHNNPSITVLPDQRLLLVYSKHHTESKFYYRTSTVAAPSSPAEWGGEQSKVTPARNTYANTYRLSGEADAIYNFHRCINFNPSVSLSLDNGLTWGAPTHVIKRNSGRPYPRYCSNHLNRIDLIYTDGHPRDLNNSIYHLFYQGGSFRGSDGAVLKTFANLPLDHDLGERGTVVYPYTAAAWGVGNGPDDWIPGGRAWTWDIHYGSDGNPVCCFQVQRDNVTGTGWNHDRIYYYYARWTGSTWQRRFIAQGGRGLYAAEDDYGGGMSIDPADPRVIYLSSNAANPFDLASIDQVPLATDSRYEIWRGFTADGGLTFSWQPITSNSTDDNLRPIVPEGHGRTRNLLWFKGNYTTFTNYATRVMGGFGEVARSYASWAAGYGLPESSFFSDNDSDGLANGVEYALGGNPLSASDRPLPTWEEGGIGFRVDPALTDVEWIVEASTDLTGWSTAAVFRAADLPPTIASGYTMIRDAVDPTRISLQPNSTPRPPHLFLRVRVVRR